MPSLTHGRAFGKLGKSRALFVSFSVKSRGTSPSQYKWYRPNVGCVAAIRPVPDGPSIRLSTGFSLGLATQDAHVFLNHRVGSTCSSAFSGPRFQTVILIRMSSGAPFAYSTKTSK